MCFTKVKRVTHYKIRSIFLLYFTKTLRIFSSLNTHKKAVLTYILTFIEPVLMLVLILTLPPLLGGQIIICWSTIFARIISTVYKIPIYKFHRIRISISAAIPLNNLFPR